ncbi:MAG TPA: hypothetical protein VLX09_24655 [Stellaceae bacterium]|nr:hypothetical protein [Stellaceae bacterium]
MATRRQNQNNAAAKQAGRGRGARRGVMATVVMIVFALLAITALPLCIILLTGLIPTMVSVLADRYRARYLTRTVGAMNLAGIAPLVFQLWTHHFTLDEAMALLMTPMSWLIMYGAAALGWALFLAMPPVARVVVDLRADQLQADLKARAKQLVAEWGEDVTGRSRSN